MINLSALALAAMCATTLFYLGSAAELTRVFWSRYGNRLDAFMTCPACAGTWYMVAVSAALRACGTPLTALPVYADMLASAMLGTFLVPVLFDVLARALRRAGGEP